MSRRLSRKELERAWQACLAKALRPIEGVLLNRTQASALAEKLLDKELGNASSIEGEASLTAHLIKTVTQSSKDTVAEDRLNTSNDDEHHDPNDKRYDNNLHLPGLKKQDHKGLFSDSEWNRLLDFLKPFGLNELKKKGILNQDAEDVYAETFAELVREKAEKQAPITRLTVFEEIIPLFVRMIQFRGLDWIRSRHAKKNQPNTQDSLEDLSSSERGGQQFEDQRTPSVASEKPLTFDAIYYQCQELLTPFEWKLVFSLYVAESVNMGEMIEDESVLQKLGLTKSDSSSTRRRRLNEQLDTTLTKLRENLQF